MSDFYPSWISFGCEAGRANKYNHVSFKNAKIWTSMSFANKRPVKWGIVPLGMATLFVFCLLGCLFVVCLFYYCCPDITTEKGWDIFRLCRKLTIPVAAFAISIPPRKKYYGSWRFFSLRYGDIGSDLAVFEQIYWENERCQTCQNL